MYDHPILQMNKQLSSKKQAQGYLENTRSSSLGIQRASHPPALPVIIILPPMPERGQKVLWELTLRRSSDQVSSYLKECGLAHYRNKARGYEEVGAGWRQVEVHSHHAP